MKTLQDEAGSVLLRPEGRGLALTEAGLEIYRRAKEFIQHEERLFKLDKNPLSPTLRIAALGVFLIPLTAALKQNPLDAFAVTLLNLAPGIMEHNLANRQLDFGITNAPVPMECMEIMETGQYLSGCYHVRGTFEDQKLADIPFVVPAHGLLSNPLGITALDGWPENHYPRNKKYLVDSFLTAITLTLQGICAIYIPDFIAGQINASRNADSRLVEYPISKKQKISQRIFLLKHKEQDTGFTGELLGQIIRKMID